jgi:hypothetical protein
MVEFCAHCGGLRKPVRRESWKIGKYNEPAKADGRIKSGHDACFAKKIRHHRA